ncbi:hypothetical protein E5Q_00305 [Mixia osmundae IAM 14324]|uniref:Rhodanese domain-containing protein n=1 Tax=Mixia osmundae (strain CBS 9802 / IAM 14324 / JCM 22182 / KY 12970) TaxID=764103 RepID=G7DSV0_MIXOS|nr:hypothetical protein E5Q_00305 [Mixia osmundae IAM 14324]
MADEATLFRLLRAEQKRQASLGTALEQSNARLKALEAQIASSPLDRAAHPPQRLPQLELVLDHQQYERYGRQMILPEIRLPGQLNLKRARLLVVGAGGLGCPALLYLAAAGVGHITLLDGDAVSLSNLHRQVVHTEFGASTCQTKVESAIEAIGRINSDVDCRGVAMHFSPSLLAPNAPIDFASYDLVLDCSDNAPTRYLLDDACMLYKKPLVSGAAIRCEGQLAVWNMPLQTGTILTCDPDVERGPSYACVFPPPLDGKLDTGDRCEDEGVLGPITGVIGVMMASEAIRLIVGNLPCQPFLRLYAPFSETPMRTLKIRRRRPESLSAALSRQQRGWPDFSAGMTCDASNTDSLNRLSAKVALSRIADGANVLDVRSATEYEMVSLPGAQNIPLSQLLKDPSRQASSLVAPLIVLCRRGNDSVIAAQALRTARPDANITDVAGGWIALASVDPRLPRY